MNIPEEDEDLREDNEPQNEDLQDERGENERDIEVSEKDGKTEVEVHRESRRERKEREFAERRRKEIDEAIGPIRQQNEALQARLGELTGLLQRNQLQPPVQQHRQQSDDDVDPDLEAIKEKQADIIRRARNAKTDEEATKLERQYRALDQKAIDLRAGKLVEAKMREYRPPQPMNYQEQQLRTEFADVFADQDAERYAASLVTKAEVAAKRRGERLNPLKVRQDALLQAAVDLGLRKPTTPAPKPAQVARLANRGGTGPLPRNDRSVRRTLTPDERKAAMAAGDPDLTPEQNIANWTRKMEKLGYFDNAE